MHLKMAWQMACRSLSTSRGPGPLSPTFVVSMKVRSLPPSPFRGVNSTVPRSLACGKSSLLNSGSTMESDTKVACKSPIFYCLVTVDQLSRHLQPSSFFETLHQPLRKTVTSQLLVRRELESVHEILAHALRWSMETKNCRLAAVRAVLYNQDSVRLLPVALLLPVLR